MDVAREGADRPCADLPVSFSTTRAASGEPSACVSTRKSEKKTGPTTPQNTMPAMTDDVGSTTLQERSIHAPPARPLATSKVRVNVMAIAHRSTVMPAERRSRFTIGRHITEPEEVLPNGEVRVGARLQVLGTRRRSVCKQHDHEQP